VSEIERVPCHDRQLLVRIAVLTLACLGCRGENARLIPPPSSVSGLSAAAVPVANASRSAAGQTAQSTSPFRFASLPTSLKPVVAARPWKYIVVHHSATAEGDVESIDAAHRERKDAAGKPWLGIGYHFVIGNGRGMADGLVEPTFRWRQQLHGAHAGQRLHNEEGIGVCLIGDFEQSDPTPRQLAAARELIASLRREYKIGADEVLRHSDVNASDCPGKRLPWKKIVPDDPQTLKEDDLR
jgi:N-acetylmuramoyl-L-alanine amidase-like protein